MSNDESNDVTVIIVSYNSRRVIINALQPLVEQSDIRVMVVDNASSDSTVSDIKSLFPSVLVVEMDQNLGFSRAVNIGIGMAKSRYIMLMNPDAVITPGDVRQLLNTLGAGIGITAPLISDPNERLRILSAGWFPTTWRMFLHFSGLSRISGSKTLFQGHYLFPSNISSRPISVDWVTGACMLFTKETWTSAGQLNEKWFMYAEDIDFCFRVKALGLEVKLTPNLSATHLVGQSDSTDSFVANPAWILNLHDFYDAELSRSKIQSLMWCLTVGLGLMSRSLAFRARGTFEGSAPQWTTEGRRFQIFAIAVFRRMGHLLSVRQARPSD